MSEDISIIITCHNLDRYLDECVESVYAQTEKVKEIIVVHDGCKAPKVYDNPMVKAVCRTFNVGVARSREDGVRYSSGKYLLFLDADDVIPEHFIQEMVKTIKIKNADIAYPNILLWSRWGDSGYDNGWYSPPKTVDIKRLLVKNEVVVTSLMKRRVFEKIGGFDSSLKIYEDWDFFLKASTLGFTMLRSDTFLKYRQRKDSRNRQHDDIKKEFCQKIRNKYIDEPRKRK